MLTQRVNELETELKNMENIINAANEYTEEHRRMMLVLGESKERYDLAYKQIMKVKKEYEKRMERVLKGFE